MKRVKLWRAWIVSNDKGIRYVYYDETMVYSVLGEYIGDKHSLSWIRGCSPTKDLALKSLAISCSRDIDNCDMLDKEGLLIKTLDLMIVEEEIERRKGYFSRLTEWFNNLI